MRGRVTPPSGFLTEASCVIVVAPDSSPVETFGREEHATNKKTANPKVSGKKIRFFNEVTY